MGRVLTVCSHPFSFRPIWRFVCFYSFVFLCLCFVQVVILFLFRVVSYSIILCCSSSLSFGTFSFVFFLALCVLLLCKVLSFSFAVSPFSSVSLLSCVSFLLGVLAACLRFLFQRLFCCRCHVAAGRRVLAAISFCDTVGVLEEVLCG